MTEHVTEWLGAYHDGELWGHRLRQVETHLAQCATCRAELEELRALATLLQESPPAAGLTPPERFVAQVGLRLPRRPERTAVQRTLEMGWRLAPLALLGAWAFVHAVFTVASGVLVALRVGLGGDTIARLLPASPPGLSLAEIFTLSGAGLNDIGRAVLRLLSQGGALSWGVTLNLVLQAVIGLLYWSWLATWWARRQRHQTRVEQEIG